MLYLHPPYYILDGVSILPDHEDPLQFYYMPLAPRLSTVVDTATGLPVPQLSLIKYRGAAGAGGFLDFDVNLGLDPERQKSIEAKLKVKAGLPDTPRLSPIPLVDGTVKLMLLGKETTPAATPPGPASSTPPATPEPTSTAPRFVLEIEHHGKPALYGDNQAAFSVQLDPAGVTVLEQALQGELAPIGVIYSLDYLALRPIFAYRVTADWSRVQTHFEESFGVSFFFASSEVTTVIDKLIEDKVIDIQLDTFVLENSDNTDLLARRDAVVAEVQRMVLDTFFEASLEPMPRDTPDETMETVSQVALLLATGGWAGSCGFRYRKIDLTRIDQKSINVTVSERGAVKMTIHPQGHLAGLFKVLREPGIELSRFVTEVGIDDPWFARRRLRLIPRANFAADNVQSLDVRVSYQGDATNRILESPTDRPEVEWASVLAGGAMVREVELSYRVSFKDVDGAERPLSLEAPPRIVDVDAVEIQPRELYAVAEVPIIAVDFPWDRYPTVEVRCRYRDLDHGIAIADDLLLTKEAATRSWRVFSQDRSKQTFDYQLVFRAADQRDLTMPYVTCADEQIIIRDPRPRKRVLHVVPNVRWTEVERVFVDLTYVDRANDVREEASFDFDKNRPEPQRFVVGLADPDRASVDYVVTFIMVDGSQRVIPASRTIASRLFVRPDMKGHKVVRVAPNPIEFGGRRLARLEVECRYVDDAAGLSFADLFAFTAHTDAPGAFELDYVDPARDAIEYRVTYTYTNGLSRATDWTELRGDDLHIPME
jgi:hypothetical protein